MQEDKADQEECRKRMALSERNIWRAEDAIEAVRLNLEKTDKHIQTILPINMVTEMNAMIGAVLPRRRHKTLLQQYTQER